MNDDDYSTPTDEQPTSGSSGAARIAIFAAMVSFALTTVFLCGLYRNHLKELEMDRPSVKSRIAHFQAKRRRFFNSLSDDYGFEPGWMTTEPESMRPLPAPSITWSVSDLTSDSHSIKSSLRMDRIEEEAVSEEEYSSYDEEEAASTRSLDGSSSSEEEKTEITPLNCNAEWGDQCVEPPAQYFFPNTCDMEIASDAFQNEMLEEDGWEADVETGSVEDSYSPSAASSEGSSLDGRGLTTPTLPPTASAVRTEIETDKENHLPNFGGVESSSSKRGKALALAKKSSEGKIRSDCASIGRSLLMEVGPKLNFNDTVNPGSVSATSVVAVEAFADPGTMDSLELLDMINNRAVPTQPVVEENQRTPVRSNCGAHATTTTTPQLDKSFYLVEDGSSNGSMHEGGEDDPAFLPPSPRKKPCDDEIVEDWSGFWTPKGVLESSSGEEEDTAAEAAAPAPAPPMITLTSDLSLLVWLITLSLDLERGRREPRLMYCGEGQESD